MKPSWYASASGSLRFVAGGRRRNLRYTFWLISALPSHRRSECRLRGGVSYQAVLNAINIDVESLYKNEKRVAITVNAILTVGFSLSEQDSDEAIPGGHAIAGNGRTHGQQTIDRGRATRHSRARGFGEDVLILVPPYYRLNAATMLQAVLLIPTLARLYVPVRRRRKSCFCGIPRYLASYTRGHK